MRFKKFTAVILIIMLLMIPIKQAEAIAPAIGPAIYYGVASLLVASGVYAATDEDLQYLVNDYWNRTSDNIKYRWQQAKLYAGVAGYLLIDKNIIGDMTDYLIYEKGFKKGHNALGDSISYEGEYPYWSAAIWQKPYIIFENGYVVTVTLSHRWSGAPTGYPIRDMTRYILTMYKPAGSTLVYDKHAEIDIATDVEETICVVIDGNLIYLKGLVWNTQKTELIETMVYVIFNFASDVLEINEEFIYTGDAAGIGHELQPEQELKVPVPPVLEKDFPDLWTDLNLERNPHLSAENQKRVLDELLGGDWYYDAENDRWYQVKKDDPPLKPGDEKKVGPLMPLPMPSTDLNTPTADAPDITTTTGPETTVTTQNQDGTTTETTTQDITETKTWYDTETGWNTETSTRTKTTTTVRDQDGTELSRDVVMGPPTGTTTTQETPKRDDDRINWDPLKLPILGLTMKFPFSLPWDLMRGLESLQSDSEWDRKFIIVVGDDLWPEMEIDLSMFDNIAQIVKVILLILFDFGLIFSTRRLMGGDV